MESRRDFLKKALLLAAGGGMAGALPASIQKALAIDPAIGSTFLDAEHIVILMQENRSFDHAYGTLRGVRGFNDPRAVKLPNGNPVWLQTNEKGETYAPWRLNIKDTRATWMGSLPHGWPDQHEARNEGRQDRWLEAKKLGHADYKHIPFTLGYYTREDITFYYDLADAFTICDQNFCSSLTPTTPNRLHLWTGTVRADANSKAHVNNEDTDYDSEANWKTFPERLEEAGVSWKIYQNEISVPSGLAGDHDYWLTNFGDNPIEWFTQYHVRFLPARRAYLQAREKSLAAELDASQVADREKKQKELDFIRAELLEYTPENFAKLPPHEQNLHLKAFANNISDPDYRELVNLPFQDGAEERQMPAPKGDIFHQFREDVRTNKLPTVSWLVAPEKFSDHPCSPWYGAWYVSETFDILTQNPEVWKKTIFILCYDENDGYFDHIPPFVPPHPDHPETGKASSGIDTLKEQVSAEHEDSHRPGPVGLGFRVPLVIASPWSRGGFVNSQVCDHTSIIKLLEVFLTHKTGQTIRETNISDWRRLVCGDLTSTFRPYNGENIALPTTLKRDAFLASIGRAENRPVPDDYKALSPEDTVLAREKPKTASFLPRQEKGTRPSCALPYELAVDGTLSDDRQSFVLTFAAHNKTFGARAAGVPYHVYGPIKSGWSRSYAVKPGDQISDTWKLAEFENGAYHIHAHGPNGFYREFKGSTNDPQLTISLSPDGKLQFVNHSGAELNIKTVDLASNHSLSSVRLGTSIEISALDVNANSGWHDLQILVDGFPDFSQRFAGRFETGRDSISDPVMGNA